MSDYGLLIHDSAVLSGAGLVSIGSTSSVAAGVGSSGCLHTIHTYDRVFLLEGKSRTVEPLHSVHHWGTTCWPLQIKSTI